VKINLANKNECIKERSGFLDKADLAYKLQKEAQDTAEKTIKQLEEFINEDAKLVNILCFFLMNLTEFIIYSIYILLLKGQRKCREHNSNFA